MQILTEADFEWAPCLREGQIAESGRNLVIASRQLGESHLATMLKAWCVPYLFAAMEKAFDSPDEPTAPINDALNRLTCFLGSGSNCNFPSEMVFPENNFNNSANESVEEITGEHYGQLFKRFSDSSYWEEPVKLLRERLERNKISVSDIEGKTVLDVGCGGGRYSAAWRLLGAEKVIGYDVSATGIADARRRVEAAEIDNVFFQEGNVLSLPFADKSFDIVFSNGVLHHTTDWQKGVSELVRVLNTQGIGWLYLIENPGGLFWDVIEILRVILKDVDKTASREALRIIGIPANRIFYMLDHVMVPVNVRLEPVRIESALTAAGADDIRRLKRGTDFDRIEQIYKKRPFAEIKYGVGENRYVFSKFP
jgi:ubiquinone/menaquinone biosynthesis C-methylase UbiE